MSKKQGYLIIATGPDQYLWGAVTAALSIRRYDLVREIALITDEATADRLPNPHPFDHVIKIAEDENYFAYTLSFRTYELSPFDETIYLDADVLMLKDHVDQKWEIFENYEFGIEGQKIFSGPAHSYTVEEIQQLLEIKWVVNINGGVYFFRKGRTASNVFDCCKKLFDSELREYLIAPFMSDGSNRPGWNPADIMGIALGVCAIQPVPDGYTKDSSLTDLIQACTPYCRDSYFDFEDGQYFLASGKDIDDVRLLSGVFCHFCGFKPREEYINLANKIRALSNYSLISSKNFDKG